MKKITVLIVLIFFFSSLYSQSSDKEICLSLDIILEILEIIVVSLLGYLTGKKREVLLVISKIIPKIRAYIDRLDEEQIQKLSTARKAFKANQQPETKE